METLENTQTQELKDFSKLLQENGFTVIVSAKHPFKWLYFEKDGKLGTVSPSHYSGFDFSTVHKPCNAAGTGYGISQDSELSVALANDSLAMGWKDRPVSSEVVKYKNAQDFIKRNAWAEYYILESEVA